MPIDVLGGASFSGRQLACLKRPAVHLARLGPTTRMPTVPMIVVNSPDIKNSIVQIDAAPVNQEDIARLWKVFTTTKRRLLDPTAERLENFWWRIWGSRLKSLTGAVVGELFRQIVEDPLVVSIHTLPRHDRGSPRRRVREICTRGASSTATSHLSKQTDSTTTKLSSSTVVKTPAPMPHPILKKSRGPSASGPRPTARFISPHESEDEKGISSCSSTQHLIVQRSQDPQSTTRLDKRAGSAPPKKKGSFLASTKKKRPVIIRRQSSQSSAELPSRHSEVAKHTMGSPLASGKTPPMFRTGQAGQKSNETPSPASDQFIEPVKNDMPQTTQDHLCIRNQPPSSNTSRSPSSRDTEPSAKAHHMTTLAESTSVRSPMQEDPKEAKSRPTLLTVTNSRLGNQKLVTATHHSGRSRDSRQFDGISETKPDGRFWLTTSGSPRLLTSEAKGTAILAPTLTAATGQINRGASTASKALLDKGKGKGRDPDEPSRLIEGSIVREQVKHSLCAADTLSRSRS